MREWADGEFAAFPTTSWSSIARAVDPADAAAAREALGALLRLYLPALRARLVVERRIDPDRAADLLQGFVADKVLEHALFARADRAAGRFRSFVLTALDRYVVDQYRAAGAKRNAPDAPVVALDDARGDRLAAAGDGPPDGFEAAWARQVIALAVERTRDECAARGRADLWELFRTRVLGPASDGLPPPPYDEVVGRFGFASPEQASNALITAKRAFARALRAVVSEYAADEDDLAQELAELRAALAPARAGGGRPPRS